MGGGSIGLNVTAGTYFHRGKLNRLTRQPLTAGVVRAGAGRLRASGLVRAGVGRLLRIAGCNSPA